MKNVLIIDDDPSIRELLELFLKRGYQVVAQATNGEEGVRLATTTNPDVVVLDYIMPNMNGDEVATAIRSSNRTRRS